MALLVIVLIINITAHYGNVAIHAFTNLLSDITIFGNILVKSFSGKSLRLQTVGVLLPFPDSQLLYWGWEDALLLLLQGLGAGEGVRNLLHGIGRGAGGQGKGDAGGKIQARRQG